MSVTRLRLIRFPDTPPIDKSLLKFARKNILNAVQHPVTVTMLVTESDIANVISHSLNVTLGVNERTIANEITDSRISALVSEEAHILNAVHTTELVSLLIKESLLDNVITEKDISVATYDTLMSPVNSVEEGSIETGLFDTGIVLNHIEWSTPIFMKLREKTFSNSVEVGVA